MKRRKFLTFSAVGMTSISNLSTAAMDCYVQRLPGVQLITIREALGRNPDQALASLAAAGIREVELFGLGPGPDIFGMPVLSFATLLQRHGITATFAHIDADRLDVPAISNNARLLGLEALILPVGPGFIQAGPNGMRAQGPQSKAEMDRLAELLNRLGHQFRTEGFLFGFHNHHVEFQRLGDDVPYDYIMWNTDPQFVRCELDIGWLALAGLDYLLYLKNYGSRTLACHLKDYDGRPVEDKGDFLGAASHLLPPGAGVVNFTGVLEWMDYHDIRHGFVEIDQSKDPLADITSGQRHLDMLRPCR